MKPLPLLLAVLLFGIGTSCTDRTDRHQKALEELDRIIERRDTYGRTKNLRIAARRDELAAAKDPRKRIALAEEIYKEYYNYDIDSAYHYARRMLALAQSYGDGTRINCARVYLAKTVLNGGMYGEAFRILHQVDTTRLAPENKSEYYNVYRSTRFLIRLSMRWICSCPNTKPASKTRTCGRWSPTGWRSSTNSWATPTAARST